MRRERKSQEANAKIGNPSCLPRFGTEPGCSRKVRRLWIPMCAR